FLDYPRGSVETANLENGKADYGGFRDPDEQRTGSDRGAVAVRYSGGEDRHHGPSAIRDAFHGGVCGRFRRRSTRHGRYAAADSIRAYLSRAPFFARTAFGLVFCVASGINAAGSKDVLLYLSCLPYV